MKQEPEAAETPTARLERFVAAEPTRSLDDWQWLWTEDRALPIRSGRSGPVGRLVVLAKKLLRPLTKSPQQDLWDRQRIFNLIVIEELRRIRDLRQDLDAVEKRVCSLEAQFDDGLREVARYNDALYSRVDLKLQRSIEQSRRLLRELQLHADGAPGHADVDASSGGAQSVGLDLDYVDFEDRHRGSESEILDRVAVHLDALRDFAPVLDLGCGRGELLRVLQGADVEGRGVDANRAMVERARTDHGLQVEAGDLLMHLRAQASDSIGAVTALHVIEHLPAEALRSLLAEALRVLRPGGKILLETPNPLSLVAGARNFWVDGTHLRPVHPEQLVQLCASIGLVEVAWQPLHPFAVGERLPDLTPPADLPAAGATVELFERLADLRDRLDGLLYGEQDYVLTARAPT